MVAMESHRPESSSGRASPCPVSVRFRAPRANARALPPQVCRVTSHPPRKSTYSVFLFLLPALYSSSPRNPEEAFSCIHHFIIAYCSSPLFASPPLLRSLQNVPLSMGFCCCWMRACRWPPRMPFPGALLHPPNLHILALPPRSSSQAPFLRPASLP